jgi:hypothetical protein
MGEESVKGANLGVILIIFAAILALGLIVFMLARNMANTGLTNVTEKLQAAEDSEFTDFDGSVVVGQRVHAALNGFKGKKVAVLIATQGFTDKLKKPYVQDLTSEYVKIGVDSNGPMKLKGTLLEPTANIGAGDGRAFNVAYATAADGKALYTTISGGSASDTNSVRNLTFIQYNAILEATDEKGVTAADGINKAKDHTVIKYDNGTYVFDGTYRTEKGMVVFDLDFANLSKTGFTEYVPGAARFHANLLKDANGVILGVVFQQVGN